MSFMYNPFPYDDPKPVNRPALKPETLAAVAGGGTPAVAKKFAAMAAARAAEGSVVIAFDGYTTAQWDLFLNLLNREFLLLGVPFETVDAAAVFKDGKDIDAMIDPLLIWDTKIDPTLLYGKIYHGGYTGLMDPDRMAAFRQDVAARRQKGKVVAVYGYGCLVRELRDLYDIKCFFEAKMVIGWAPYKHFVISPAIISVPKTFAVIIIWLP